VSDAGNRARPRVVAAVLISAGVVSSLVYSLAMPLIAEFPAIFDVSAASATWIIVANSVSGAVATPVMGRIGDTWGPRRTLIGSMSCVAVGSLVCAAAPNLGVMVLGRVLQGVGAGTVPLAIGIVRSVVPASGLGVVVGTLSATLGLGSGVGITMAGLLLAHGGWRFVFVATAVLAAVVVLLLVRFVPPEARPAGHPLDVWGAVGLGLTLSFVLIPLSKGVEWGWVSPPVLTMAAFAAVVSLLWGRHQWRRARPMVNLRLATNGPIAGALLISVAVGGGIFFSLLTTVIVIQAPEVTGYGLGHTALVAGLCLIPGNLMMLVAPVPAARLARRRGVRVVLRVGLLLMACGYFFRLAFDDNLVQVSLGYLGVQTGVAACLAGLPMAIVRNAPVLETASAQALGTTMRHLGIAAAGAGYAALVAALHVAVGDELLPTPQAVAISLLAAAAISLVGVAGTYVVLRSERKVPAGTR
jgi:MFS family permease